MNDPMQTTEDLLRRIAILHSKVESLKVLLVEVAQLLAGWSQDGSAWTSWDQSVLDRVRDALAGRKL